MNDLKIDLQKNKLFFKFGSLLFKHLRKSIIFFSDILIKKGPH